MHIFSVSGRTIGVGDHAPASAVWLRFVFHFTLYGVTNRVVTDTKRVVTEKFFGDGASWLRAFGPVGDVLVVEGDAAADEFGDQDRAGGALGGLGSKVYGEGGHERAAAKARRTGSRLGRFTEEGTAQKIRSKSKISKNWKGAHNVYRLFTDLTGLQAAGYHFFGFDWVRMGSEHFRF